MEQFKKASQLKLRFNTDRGPLSVEQLWDLNQTQLSNLIKAIKKTLTKDNDDELSFLLDTSVVDIESQLRFDIAKDIYLTKKKDAEEARDVANKKANQQKILEIISRKKEASLEDKSIEELEALLN